MRGALAALGLAAMAAAQADERACDLAGITQAAELQRTLSLRAVEAIDLAAQATPKAAARLAALVAPDARFMLGAGDVGEDMGTGPEGIRRMALMIHANLFIFAGWDYMDMPAESPCGAQKVSVEFLNNRRKSRCVIAFTFTGGRVTQAEGWRRSYTTGPVTPPKGP
jgi:hypothetical protein